MARVAPVFLSTTTSFQDRRAWCHSLSGHWHERITGDLLSSGPLTLVVGQPVNFQNSHHHPLGSTPAPQSLPCPARSSLNYGQNHTANPRQPEPIPAQGEATDVGPTGLL